MSDATLESPSRGNDRRILIILSVFICLVAVVILVVAAVMLSLIISRLDDDDDDAKVTKLDTVVQGKHTLQLFKVRLSTRKTINKRSKAFSVNSHYHVPV